MLGQKCIKTFGILKNNMIIYPETFVNQILSDRDLAKLESIESNDEIIFEHVSDFHNIKVVKNQCGQFLKFDESFQSGKIETPFYSGNLPYTNYFLLPVLYKPEIKNILFLGMGSACIIKDFLKLCPDLKRIDIVEIDPLIPQIATDYFDFKAEKPVNVHIQDARIFVRQSTHKYDLIICDVFSAEGMPYRFMTTEFFKEAKKALKDKGILCVNAFSNVNLHSPLNVFFKSLYKTCFKVFQNTDFFPTTYGNMQMYRQVLGLKDELTDITNAILIAQNNGLNISKNELELKADELQRNVNLSTLKYLKKYATDYCEDKINLDSVKILKDNFIDDEDFTLENMSKYLLVNEQ